MSAFVYTENPETNDYSFKEVESNFVCLPETDGNYVIVKNDSGYSLQKNGVVTVESVNSAETIDISRPCLLVVEIAIGNLATHCEFETFIELCFESGSVTRIPCASLTSNASFTHVISEMGETRITYHCGCGFCESKMYIIS